MPLEVQLCTAFPYKDDDGSLGWRIIHVRSDKSIPIRFMRKVDALRAMKAILPLVDWSMSIDEVIEAVDIKTVRYTMIEALAW